MTSKTPWKSLFIAVFALATVLSALFGTTALVLATGVDDVKTGIDGIAGAVGLNVGGNTDPLTIVGGVVKTLLGFLGVAFLLLIIYAGFKWMLSMGESKKIEGARKIITSASVGLGVIVLSYAIVTFVLSLLGTATGGGGGNRIPCGGTTCNPNTEQCVGCPTSNCTPRVSYHCEPI